MTRVRHARELAIRYHATQRYGKHPYVYHLDQVVEILQPYGEIAQIVGYLHDVVEDTIATPEVVLAQFGQLVGECVSILTDEPGASRRERKQRTYRKMAAVQGEQELALIVKTADRLANTRSCVENDKARRLAAYRDEFAVFHRSVFRPGLCDELWAQLTDLSR